MISPPFFVLFFSLWVDGEDWCRVKKNRLSYVRLGREEEGIEIKGAFGERDEEK